MKKSIYLFGLFALCFGFGFWISSSKVFPTSAQNEQTNSDVVSKASVSIPIQNLAEADVPQVHQYYFSPRVEIEAASPLFWEKTLERFRKPLPQDASKHQVRKVRELAARLSILRSMGEWGQFQKEKYQFYLSLLEDRSQHWLVHREALHQIRPLLRLQGKEERDRILSLVSSKVRGLASLSTRELLLPLGEQR